MGVEAIGAGIGAGVDALIRGRRTIYEVPRGSPRIQAAPILTRRAAGVRVSLAF